MLLFLDTETTGKWDFSHGWDWPTQPNLVQLGMLLCRDDPDCTQVRSLNVVVRPEHGWDWSAEAEAVHGISREWALATGEPLARVIDKAITLMGEADEDGMGGCGRVIAHNIQFDTNVMLRAMQLYDRDLISYNLLRRFCTMLALTPRLNLPGKFPGKPKWPTLDEAYEGVLGAPIPAEGRHSAMGDLLACRDIFIEGRRRGWWL